ncbi:MAG: STAS domain-containing protein [Planctomycetota bacterium]|jgi:anti-anti-sigma factor
MAIQHAQDNIIAVDLSKEPQTSDELKKVIERLRSSPGCDVIIDFSNVDILRSPSLRGLLALRQLLACSRHKLVLYNVGRLTRGIFETTHLHTAFCFVDDRSAALRQIEVAAPPPKL